MHVVIQIKFSLKVNKVNNVNIYIDFNKENYKGDPKFKVGDHVRISKYKNIL